MLQVEWNEHLLQAIGEDAVGRKQSGVIVWCNSNRWHTYHKRVTFDRPNLQKIAEKIENGLAVWFDFSKRTIREILQENCDEEDIYKCEDGGRFAELVVPAKLLVENLSYREWILRILKAKEMQGPVTLFPAVRLSNIHFSSGV